MARETADKSGAEQAKKAGGKAAGATAAGDKTVGIQPAGTATAGGSGGVGTSVGGDRTGAGRTGAGRAGNAPRKGPDLAPHQIILRPLVTEKGVHRSTRNNQYAFEVNSLADKDTIRQAIESMFEVKVLRVRTQNRKGKPRRHRFKMGYTRNWKKALITLNPDHRIDFF